MNDGLIFVLQRGSDNLLSESNMSHKEENNCGKEDKEELTKNK